VVPPPTRLSVLLNDCWHIQAIVRMERSGAKPVVSRQETLAKVLAALGAHGVLMQPRGVVLVSEMKTPAEEAAAGVGQSKSARAML
jgi:hypothetical protein